MPAYAAMAFVLFDAQSGSSHVVGVALGAAFVLPPPDLATAHPSSLFIYTFLSEL